MKETFDIMILGIIQGLTEFLPISSSGHLVVFKNVLHFDPFLDVGPLIEVSLHVGTLISILLFYRRDLLSLFRFVTSRSAGREAHRDAGVLLKWIIVGSIPTAILGFLFKDWFESCFSNLVFVGLALCVTGGLCLVTRFVPRGRIGIDSLGFFRAFCVGLAQGLAIVPGLSRSGSTIVTALCLGVRSEEAGRFSFLLSLPAVAGAALLTAMGDGNLGRLNPLVLIPGILASALVGYLCLGILTRILRSGSFFYFGFYCIPVGGMVVWYFS